MIGVVCLVEATFALTTGRWGNLLSVYWLKPGDSLLSIQYLLFAITSLAFITGGILALSKRYWLGFVECGLACLLPVISMTLLARLEGRAIAIGDVALLALYFGGPGALCLWGGLRAKEQVSSLA